MDNKANLFCSTAFQRVDMAQADPSINVNGNGNNGNGDVAAGLEPAAKRGKIALLLTITILEHIRLRNTIFWCFF